MNDVPCDCCAGPRVATPGEYASRPGLGKLDYRVGTYATFFDSMRAQLSSAAFFSDAAARMGHQGPLGLAGLTTRAPDDFSMALLDAWAITADVLGFYQERIANEGYLRCATERRSVLELARLPGYAPRPGVAASVYLAYALEKDAAPVVIPPGARVNSVPAPGQQMQSFETAEALTARAEWNQLTPRLRRPLRLLPGNAVFLEHLRFKGVATGLAKNDVLLLTFGREAGRQVLRTVAAVTADSAANETAVSLQLPSLLKPVLMAWSDVSARYADLEWRCLPKSEALLPAVVDALLALQGALDDLIDELDPDIEDAGQLEGGQIEKFQIVIQRHQDFKLAARRLLALGDRETLAWLIAYYLEAFRYLSAGLLGESALRALFARDLGLPPDADASMPGQSLLGTLIPALSRPVSRQPANSRRLPRQTAASYAPKSDLRIRLLTSLQPALASNLYPAWRNVAPGEPAPAQVFALRVRAPLFGHNAPKRTRVSQDGVVTVIGDWPVLVPVSGGGDDGGGVSMREDRDAVHLDAAYDKIVPDSWLVVVTPSTSRLTEQRTRFFLAGKSSTAPNTALTRAEYGMTGRTTRITLLEPASLAHGSWIRDPGSASPDNGDDFEAIRRTAVHAGSEPLELAELPVTDDVCGERVELDDLYDGLEAGRWLIVSGERSDVRDAVGRAVAGVMASELVMLAGVTQDVARVPAEPGSPLRPGAAPARAAAGGIMTRLAGGAAQADGQPGAEPADGLVALPGDSVHSYLEFATALAYRFKRATVTIRANVVRATHGETRAEVLGSGAGDGALQRFTLKQAPLTHVSAATVSGVASTLTVRVNDIEWHETDSLVGLGPQERKFVARSGDDGKTTIVFGNGRNGARLPAGQENVRAVYRSGIGQPGNLAAGQLSLLASRPLGVKSVVNPLRASGGADPESRDQIRVNAPLAVMALDRLVSVQDHADFARTFGGVGKASAAARSDGRRQVVHLTIAGVDDSPIDAGADLLRNLRGALQRYGDPALPVRLQVRERLVLVVAARVRLQPDYLWEAVEPLLRRAMLAAFGFDTLELGRDLFASHAIAVLQAISGVAYVDLDVFDVMAEQALLDGLQSPQAGALLRRARIALSPGGLELGKLRPAQIAYLPPDVPDTLILQEIAS